DPLIGRPAQSVLLVVLPATIVMGFAFPTASALLSDDDGLVATSAGRLLAVNTVGAIAGTFLVPFFVVPLLGSPHAVVLLAVLNGIAGILVAVAAVGASRIRRAAITLAGVAAVGLLIGTALTGGIPLDPR